MTLVITMIAKNKVVQVADTRLTLNGYEYDANAIKSVCVSCADAYFTIGYSGVAEITGQPLDEWLKDRVSELMTAGFHGVKQITDEIAQRLDKEVAVLTFRGRSVGKQRKGLLLVLAGFQHDPEGQRLFRLPFLTTISNIERWELGKAIKVADQFRVDPRALCSAVPGSKPRGTDAEPVCVVNGERLALFAHDKHAKETKQMLNMVRRWLQRIDQGPRSDSRTSSTLLAKVIQHASTHPKYGKVIGPDCISVVMHPNSREMFSRYHPLEATTIKRKPHYVALG